MATPTTLPAAFVAGSVLTAQQQNDLRGAFRILQVVSAFKADSFSLSTVSFVDVTGLSVTITPSSSSSKILVTGQLSSATANGDYLIAQLVRGSTAIGSGTAGSTYNGILINPAQSQAELWTEPFFFIDSPSTTSATTYKMQIRSSSTSTAYVNRRGTDAVFGASSTICVMEISA